MFETIANMIVLRFTTRLTPIISFEQSFIELGSFVLMVEKQGQRLLPLPDPQGGDSTSVSEFDKLLLRRKTGPKRSLQRDIPGSFATTKLSEQSSLAFSPRGYGVIGAFTGIPCVSGPTPHS